MLSPSVLLPRTITTRERLPTTTRGSLTQFGLYVRDRFDYSDMKRLTPANYTKDKLYPAVARSISELLRENGHVAPVEVLLRMQRITKQQYEDWRFARIPYLERITLGGLGKMNRILRIIDLHCRKLNLAPSQTTYRKWGKGRKRITLRFSKSGHPNLEAAYSRHYVAKKSKPDRDVSEAERTTARETRHARTSDRTSS